MKKQCNWQKSAILHIHCHHSFTEQLLEMDIYAMQDASHQHQIYFQWYIE